MPRLTAMALQRTALHHPCRCPEDRRSWRFCRWQRVGDLALTVSLTVDAERRGDGCGDFVPPGLGGAAWHASASLYLAAGLPEGVFPAASDAIPLHLWSAEARDLGRRAALLALEGAGIPGRDRWYSGISALHCWRRLGPTEREAFEGRLN